MNAPVEGPLLQAQRLTVNIGIAAERIAPTWPLDQFIAVNPYWNWVGRPIQEAAATLGMLAGTRLTMPREWFREQWAAGRLQRRHLELAVARDLPPVGVAGETWMDGHTAHVQAGVEMLLQALEGHGAPLSRLPLVTDLRDHHAPARPGLRWADLVTHQVSQHCAAYFDQHQASWTMDRSLGLYGSWREQLDADHGLPWRQGRRALRARVAALPDKPRELIAAALAGLTLPQEGHSAYLSAVLMAIGGWGAWCAYERWQARLGGADDDQIVHLLAIRLAWEWLLWEDAAAVERAEGWAERWGAADAAAQTLKQSQRVDWWLQSAIEIAYQQPVIDGLRQRTPPAKLPVRPSVQALFCIDVRSEVLRRALESVSTEVRTRGFAGFFGLPIAYQPLGSALKRPQLPGLLAPQHCVTECAEPGLGQVLARQRRSALLRRQRWAAFRKAPASAFSFVESLGLLYGPQLLADSLPSSADPQRWEDEGLSSSSASVLRPRLPAVTEDPAAAAAMARGILRAMGLQSEFAPLVLLVGHGSRSANNPHAAGLDCGACGGQTGEVNARVLADLLNDGAVREQLRGLGVDIPADTHFLPALHNTTTDEVQLHDTDVVPDSRQSELAQLRAWLDAAAALVRAERAPGLGLADGSSLASGAELKLALQHRANDWAQVRPEWGLADNAAFIVAPRDRSRHLNLGGRSFLHDYDHRLDPDRSVLTLIMTAPMVVTHWINMQYHASTVDNRRYGSGNKLLHNVVGGHIGVFEGNGGDLRIGLPIQSLHDGQRLRHTPLRLSVFIEAPREAIETVMAGHEIVRQLVNHEWLHLFRIDPQGDGVEQFRQGAWRTAG